MFWFWYKFLSWHNVRFRNYLCGLELLIRKLVSSRKKVRIDFFPLNSYLKGDFTCTSNSIRFSVSVWGSSIPFLSSSLLFVFVWVCFWVYLYPLGRACLQMKLECTRGMFSFHWTTDFYNSPWKHMVNLYTMYCSMM